MIKRHFWLEQIERAWKKRSVIWLFGVRRAGKTMLCQSLEGVEYFDCELPRVRRSMEDPEGFLSGLRKKKLVLDEVHRLPNPSELLKIAADHFPDIRVIATGSSTLQATRKFRDSLTGRKVELWLTPMAHADLKDFSREDLAYRFLRGGLPPFFLSGDVPERDYQEWMDSYWAKDIQELFRLERRSAFQRFVELLLAQSGGIFEATAYAVPCEISRPTVTNYLKVLEATRVCHVIRPYSSHRPTEIVSAPKVFGFDTGFVCYFRGWHELRAEDKGVLWEHYVLNEIQSRTQGALDIRYWRDKKGHEVDFILKKPGKPPVAIECKWSSKGFDAQNMAAFRRQYPEGENWVISGDVERIFQRREKTLSLSFMGIHDLDRRLMEWKPT